MCHFIHEAQTLGFPFSSAGVYDCLIFFLNGLLANIFRDKYILVCSCELGITVKGFLARLEDDAVFPTVMIS